MTARFEGRVQGVVVQIRTFTPSSGSSTTTRRQTVRSRPSCSFTRPSVRLVLIDYIVFARLVFVSAEEMRNLATELQTLVQAKVGVSAFSSVWNSITRTRALKRQARRSERIVKVRTRSLSLSLSCFARCPPSTAPRCLLLPLPPLPV